jgi:hypothetical protein
MLRQKGLITQQEYDQNIQAAVENEEFKEKRLPDTLPRGVLNKVCHKLHTDEGNNIDDGVH